MRRYIILQFPPIIRHCIVSTKTTVGMYDTIGIVQIIISALFIFEFDLLLGILTGMFTNATKRYTLEDSEHENYFLF